MAVNMESVKVDFLKAQEMIADRMIRSMDQARLQQFAVRMQSPEFKAAVSQFLLGIDAFLEALGISLEEFAEMIGVSPESVEQAMESFRRYAGPVA